MEIVIIMRHYLHEISIVMEETLMWFIDTVTKKDEVVRLCSSIQ